MAKNTRTFRVIVTFYTGRKESLSHLLETIIYHYETKYKDKLIQELRNSYRLFREEGHSTQQKQKRKQRG